MDPKGHEYVLLKFRAGTLSHITERINQHAEEGYEPIMMSGDENTTILLRRAKEREAAEGGE